MVEGRAGCGRTERAGADDVEGREDSGRRERVRATRWKDARAARDGRIIAVVDDERVAENLAQHVLKVPEALTPLIPIVPLQLLS